MLNSEVEQVVEEPEVVKRRGRRKKVRENPVVEDAAVNEVAEETKPRKLRKKSVKVDEGKLAAQLIGGHIIASRLLRIDLTIDQQEAEMLASGISDVAKQYDIAINPKLAAWFGLATAAAMVYVPRVPMVIDALNERKKRVVNHAVA